MSEEEKERKLIGLFQKERFGLMSAKRCAKITQAYADQEVKPVKMELERWKYLYQTEFNKNKLKQ